MWTTESAITGLTKQVKALEVERDALRLRVAALQGYIALARNHLHSQDEQARTNATVLLDSAGDTTALREMLVEAVRESDKWREETPESIADRILGASKGGVE